MSEADERTTALPADQHVHSEWSWDALAGSMVDTCSRAVELGLPSVAFTEHADFTPWVVPPEVTLPVPWQPLLHDGVLTPPALNVTAYLGALEECRDRFPALRILSGVELSEPHWYAADAARLLAAGGFERVLASVHSGPGARPGEHREFSAFMDSDTPGVALRAYLDETARLVTQFDGFEVLAHIDYPVRSWPASGPVYDPYDFRDEYHHALRLLAAQDKVLELNTRVPLHPEILRWWHEEGGTAISFASDAHEPAALAAGFTAAARVAEATGFRPDRDPTGFWRRA